MRIAAVAVCSLAVVLVCSACPERRSELEPGPDCSAQMRGDTSTLAQRELQLGVLIDGVFTPWQDGQQVMLIVGFQGSSMITPWFEIPAEANDEDGACWHVLVEHLAEDGEVDYVAYDSGLVFSLVEDTMQTGPLFDDGIYEETLRLRATVSTAEFVAVRQLTLEVPF